MEIIKRIFTFEPLWTVLCGVIVFVVCESYKEVCISVVTSYRRLKMDISEALTFYANIYHNPRDVSPEKLGECLRRLRELASKLEGVSSVKSWYILGVPRRKNLVIAQMNLIGLSNTSNSDNELLLAIQQPSDINEYELKIRKALGII